MYYMIWIDLVEWSPSLWFVFQAQRAKTNGWKWCVWMWDFKFPSSSPFRRCTSRVPALVGRLTGIGITSVEAILSSWIAVTISTTNHQQPVYLSLSLFCAGICKANLFCDVAPRLSLQHRPSTPNSKGGRKVCDICRHQPVRYLIKAV